MARDQAKKSSDSRGKKKSERHSARTRENKARRAARREARMEAAANRRFADAWIDPITGKRATKGQMREITQRRFAQADRIKAKAAQRRRFSRLSPAEKARARAAAPDGARTKPKQEETPPKLSRGPSIHVDLSHILTA